MGYAIYTLPDGREAGYAVEAQCDRSGCLTLIDRGLGCLCGDNPNGHRDPDEFGCGNYFCGDHLHDHDCPAPECGVFSPNKDARCDLIRGHEGDHYSNRKDRAFTETYDTDEKES